MSIISGALLSHDTHTYCTVVRPRSPRYDLVATPEPKKKSRSRASGDDDGEKGHKKDPSAPTLLMYVCLPTLRLQLYQRRLEGTKEREGFTVRLFLPFRACLLLPPVPRARSVSPRPQWQLWHLKIPCQKVVRWLMCLSPYLVFSVRTSTSQPTNQQPIDPY